MTPFLIDTRDLGRRPGAMRTVQQEVTMPARLGTDVIAIDEGATVDLDLRLESVMEGVLVSGTASTLAHGICGRCLRPVTEELTADLNELFAYPERAAEFAREASEDDDPLPVLDGESLDLGPTLIDALVPALPFQPLCRPDCPGLCPECGIPLDEAEPGHGHAAPIDPRWAALTALGEETGNTANSGSTGHAGPAEPPADPR